MKELNLKVLFIFASIGSRVVEHSPHCSKVQGSSPATNDTIRENGFQGATTIGIATLSIMTFSITTQSIIVNFSIRLLINYAVWHFLHCYVECRLAKFRLAECRGTLIKAETF